MKLYCRFMLVLFYDSTKGWLLLKLCLRRIVITNTKTDLITSTSFLLPYIHAQATKPLNRIRKEKKKSDQFHPCLVPNKLNGLRPTTSACHLSRVLTLRALFKCFYPNPLQAVLQCHWGFHFKQQNHAFVTPSMGRNVALRLNIWCLEFVGYNCRTLNNL